MSYRVAGCAGIGGGGHAGVTYPANTFDTDIITSISIKIGEGMGGVGGLDCVDSVADNPVCFTSTGRP